MGSSRLALRAGYQPKKTPVAKHTAKLTITLVMETLMGMLKNVFTISEAAMPSVIPMTPPKRLMMTDSNRNWNMMSRPRAPIAMRRPISFVRSVTETYMMFMIPIPPTNKLIPAIIVSTSDIKSEVLVTIWIISSCVNTRNGSVGFVQLRRSLRIPIISSVAFSA